MPRAAKLRVVAFTQDHKKRFRVAGPKILAEPGKKEFRGPTRRTRMEANADLYDAQKRLANLQNDIPELTAAQRMDAERAFKRMAEHKYTLDQLVEFALEHLDLLGRRKSRTFQDAWKSNLVQMEGAGLSPRHVATSRYYLRFSERNTMPGFYGDLRELDSESIREWLIKAPGGNNPKLNWLRYARAVVNRAKDDGYLERNVLQNIEPPKARKAGESADITYLTPDQALSLLNATPKQDIPWLAISLFAGIRASEVERLAWEDVSWERLEIHVAKHKSKTRVHRVVTRRLSKWRAWCIDRGLPEPRLRLLDMPKRWGSAKPDGRINLNPRLIKAPSICVDYVIIHEICHLKYPNHERAFYNLLSQLCVNWEHHKARLEKY